MKKPFIHLFSCSNGKYLYDVNSDNIFKISDESYQILENGNTYNHQLKYLEEIGFLREDKVKLTEHPAGAVLSEFYENQLHGLTLQVTQNCNLRCDYCVYSGFIRLSHGTVSSGFRVDVLDAGGLFVAARHPGEICLARDSPRHRAACGTDRPRSGICRRGAGQAGIGAGGDTGNAGRCAPQATGAFAGRRAHETGHDGGSPPGCGGRGETPDGGGTPGNRAGKAGGPEGDEA